MSDTIIRFPAKGCKGEKPSIAEICKNAGETFTEIVIIGCNQNGDQQVITTVEDPANFLWYLESTKIAVLTGAFNGDGTLD